MRNSQELLVSKHPHQPHKSKEDLLTKDDNSRLVAKTYQCARPTQSLRKKEIGDGDC